MIHVLFLALVFLFISSTDVHAAAVVPIIVGVGTAFKAALTVKAIIGTFLRFAVSAAISRLAKRFQARRQKQAGIQTTHTTTGGNRPQTTIVGRYATKGHLVYHNAYDKKHRKLVHIIELGDLPGVKLRRLIIDGEYADLAETESENLGLAIRSKDYKGDEFGWIRFHDGTQTEADAVCVSEFGDDEERPWTAEHRLLGIPYAVCTFHRKDEVYPNGKPEYAFEIEGIPLYDPRRDSSAGGVGPQRWDNPNTWSFSDNAIVIAYNVARGISLRTGEVWGGGLDVEDLPFTQWALAMERCDREVGRNNRRKYRAGFEIKFSDPPMELLEDLFQSCNAELVNAGGFIYPVIDDQGDLRHTVNDPDDLLIDRSASFDPFPPVTNRFNTVQVSYTSPAALWQGKPGRTIRRAEWVEEDGAERLFDLQLPLVFDLAQANQLGDALVRDNRKFRNHRIPLPPEYCGLLPEHKIQMNSPFFGYDNKLFKVTEVALDLYTLNSAVSIRETDPSDFDTIDDLEIPEPPVVTGQVVLEDLTIPGFAAEPVRVGSEGGPQVPGILVSWDPDLKEDATSITIRATANGRPVTFSFTDLESGTEVIQPLLPDTDYLVDARARGRKLETNWTVPIPVRTPDTRSIDDLLSEDAFETLRQEARDSVAPILQQSAAERDVLLTINREKLNSRALDDLQGHLLATQRADQAERRAAIVARDTHKRVSKQGEAIAEMNLQLGAAISETAASLEVERSARVEADEAIAEEVSALRANVDQTGAALLSESVARAEADQALVGEVDTLRAYVETQADNQSATATALQGTVGRVENLESGQTALSQSVATNAAEIAGVGDAVVAQADVINQQTTQVNNLGSAVSAQAQAVQSLSTQVGEQSATVEQISETQNGLSATHVLRVNADGHIAGFVLASDASDPNAPESQMTFLADSFRMVGPNGEFTPFVAHATPRTIDGRTYPPGVYLENVYIGDGFARDLSISGLLQSPNYRENSQGIPTRGVQVDFQSGTAKFAGHVQSRNLAIAEGSFTVQGAFDNRDVFDFVNTGIRVSVEDARTVNEVALVAVATVRSGSHYSGGSDVYNSFWGATAQVLFGPRIYGFTGSNPQPSREYQRDPTRLVDPWWSNGTDQRIYLRIQLSTQGLSGFVDPVIDWKVFEVT